MGLRTHIGIGRDAAAVSSVCVPAEEVELTESLRSNSGSRDIIDGSSWKKHTEMRLILCKSS